MKNTIKYSLLISTLFGFLTSCEDPDAIRLPEFKDAVNVRVVIDPDNTFLDFEDLANAKFVFDAYTENTDLQSAIFYMSYYDLSEDSIFNEIPVEFTDFPTQHYEYTSQELAEIFNLPGGIDHLDGGDLFNFRTEAVTAEGLTYPDTVLQGLTQETLNVTPEIINAAATTSFTSVFNTFVGCPSSLDGVYSTVVNGTSTDDCCGTIPAVDVESTVTFTRTGPTNYALTNFAAGAYSYWYCDAYGLCSDTFDGLGAQLLDICGNVQLTAGYWGSAGAGTVDPNTGVITIDWQNAFGDQGTTVYTPQ
jgi:hypothetical protein